MKNLYQGVNPHLNSLLQTPGTDAQPSAWPTFHAAHINHITDALNNQLPDNYVAFSEHSLQLRGEDADTSLIVRRPQPDVTIFQQAESRQRTPETSYAQPTWRFDLLDVMEPEMLLKAVVIHRLDAQSTFGIPVTRIELLSPANKPGGTHYPVYHIKRLEAVQTGIPLIEIDYLHETRSPIPGLPDYPHDSAAHPYAIAITDPRPEWRQGQIEIFGFDVQANIPTLPIPLAAEDVTLFDFDAVYQHTFQAGRWGKFVDYSQPPARFDSYSPADQARIRQRMAVIAAERP